MTITVLIDQFIDIFLSPIGITEPVFQFMFISALLGLSIYITLYTGMFSLANAGFMAMGAYISVVLTQESGWALLPSLLAGMTVAGVIAIPIGLPVLRLKDIYLAIATIGFGEVVRVMLLNFDNIVQEIMRAQTGERIRFELLRGARGFSGIPKLTETWMLILALIILMYIFYRLHRSRFGRAMAAIRQDEQAASNMGINTVYVKTAVFVMSAMIAALAGGFQGHLVRTISPGDFDFNLTVNILAYAVLGGTSTWAGPIVGGFVLTALPEVLRAVQEYRGFFNGLVLLLVIVFLPGGLIDPAGWRNLWSRFRSEDDTRSANAPDDTQKEESHAETD